MGYLMLLLVLFSAATYSGCIENPYEGTKVIEVVDIDERTITKIDITNGHTGDFITITDKAKITDLMNYLNKHKVEKRDNQDVLVGYAYSMTFYNESSRVSRIILLDSTLIEIDEVYYDINNSTMDIVVIEEIIN